MQVIPPGMDFTNVEVQEDTPDADGELASSVGGAEGSSPKAVPTIWSEVSFHMQLHYRRPRFFLWTVFDISLREFGRL